MPATPCKSHPVWTFFGIQSTLSCLYAGAAEANALPGPSTPPTPPTPPPPSAVTAPVQAAQAAQAQPQRYDDDEADEVGQGTVEGHNGTDDGMDSDEEPRTTNAQVGQSWQCKSNFSVLHGMLRLVNLQYAVQDTDISTVCIHQWQLYIRVSTRQSLSFFFQFGTQ